MDTFTIELKKYHDVFLANLMLVLKLNTEKTTVDNYKNYLQKCDLASNILVLINNFDISKRTLNQTDDEYKEVLYTMTFEKVNDNLAKLKLTSNNFLNSILNGEMTMDGVSGIIKKIFTAVSSNYEYLTQNNPKLFQLKTMNSNNKQVTMTIIPGADMIYSWYCLTNDDRSALWFYLNNMFVSGTKMIHLVNETSVNNFDIKLLNELNYNKLKKCFIEQFPEQNVINTMNLDIDPFLGVGTSGGDFSIEQMLEATKDMPKGPDAPGIGSMAKMFGVDKMFNMEELSKQLKNINKSEIDEATKNIQKMLGSNVDENTSDMIGSILTDITEHLKTSDLGSGDPIQNIINIAEKVAQKAIPKIDQNKVDMKKIFESTQNLASNYKDQNGNSLMSNNNPFGMLTSLLQNPNMGSNMNEAEQMKMAEDMMKNLTKQMSSMQKQVKKSK